ncbi:unnamed protein product [Caenorhabditis nigoni]
MCGYHFYYITDVFVEILRHLISIRAQLIRLKIVSTFPDIIQVADDLYHSYNEDQLNCVLTTFDMHQVIAKCILAHCVY